MTQTTQFAGTTPYMAPEQLRGKTVFASDIFALGVVAYELQTGRRPFDATNPVELFEQQKAGLKQGGAIARELSFRPEDRSRSARDAANAMATAMLQGDIRWTRRKVTTALFSGGVLASTGIWYLWPDAPLTAAERVIQLPPGKEPEENGWQMRGDIIWRAVYNDDATGVIANRLITKEQGRYFHPLTRRQAAATVRFGWTIIWEADVQEGANIIHLDFPGAARRFSLNLLRESDGTDHVLLPTVIGAKNDGLRWPIPGPAGRRHRFAMRWNASTGLAVVDVDGARRITDYAGMNEYRDRRGLEISVNRYKSSGASGVVWLARLQIGQTG